MRRLTSFLNSVSEAIEEQRAYQTGGRPTSLQEAGRTGMYADGRPVRPRPLPEAVVESAKEQTAEERTTRRPIAPAAVSRPVPDTALRIRTALRNPASFRTAILLREVLDEPVSKRPRSR
jgi:hypothetical protein